MAQYYVRISTYWQNSPNWFVGPFVSRAAAEAAIEEAEKASGSKVYPAASLGGDIRYGIRVHGVASATEAKSAGLRNNYEALNVLPHSTGELERLMQEVEGLYAE